MIYGNVISFQMALWDFKKMGQNRVENLHAISQSPEFAELHLVVKLGHPEDLEMCLSDYSPLIVQDDISKGAWLAIVVDHVAQMSDLPAVIEAYREYGHKRK